jgi:hypothetical protein
MSEAAAAAGGGGAGCEAKEALLARKPGLLQELGDLLSSEEMGVSHEIIAHESTQTLLTTPSENPDEEIKRLDQIIARHVQDQHTPLTELSQKIHSVVAAVMPDKDLIAVREKILALASRKTYGMKSKGESPNEDSICLERWMWEVNDLNLLPAEFSAAIKKARKLRKLVCFLFGDLGVEK